MATYNAETKIRVEIREETPDGVFRDALHFSKADFESMTDEDVAAMKQDRVASWRATVHEMRIAARDSESLRRERDAISDHIASLQARHAELVESLKSARD